MTPSTPSRLLRRRVLAGMALGMLAAPAWAAPKSRKVLLVVQTGGPNQAVDD